MLHWNWASSKRGQNDIHVAKNNIPLIIKPAAAANIRLNLQHKAGRIHALTLFTPNSDSTIWMLPQQLWLSKPSSGFPPLPLSNSGVNCVLFGADMGSTQCALLQLLLKGTIRNFFCTATEQNKEAWHFLFSFIHPKKVKTNLNHLYRTLVLCMSGLSLIVVTEGECPV